ncbi:hypothetical protein HMPREF9140_01658 [Prevotella micans F0438]|uniref:Uncharacterized protein n=1 Tax=Prevotella micans F0438 TaxID=883158 RepID=H1Q420_9BACT|nr:hypothetical protein HMPREF9140_01658 [Prevotella micans F0438]
MKYKPYHLSAKPAPKHYATISRREQMTSDDAGDSDATSK